MPTLTLSIPEDLKRDMESIPEMNWSEVARGEIQKRVVEYKLFREITSKSRLSEKDALEIGEKIKESLYKAHKKRFEELKR